MEKERPQEQTVDIFFSYASQDEDLRNELETHLALLKRQGQIRTWHDRRIDVGQEWQGAIDAHLESADLILLLISPAFIASDYCWGREMKRALERHENGKARVIPIILRPVDWHGSAFGKLRALPRNGRPLTSWENRDEALLSVVQDLRTIIEKSTRQRNRLTSIGIERFSVFDEAHLEFGPGLNVLIGLNATGKSHLMKLAYALLAGWVSSLREGATNGVATHLSSKLAGVFQPEEGQLGRLVRRPEEMAEISLECENSRLQLRWHNDGKLELAEPVTGTVSSGGIFIPTREVLSMYEGFMAAYETRELSFDETYYDICVAMSANPLRSSHLEDMREFLVPLEAMLGGKVRLQGNRFYVESGGERTEAHLMAEGMRKIAVLAHLVRNGSLGKDSILFWDEPESNLNPRLITKIAETLHQLANAGMQIIIATHDYLLSHELSLLAEYAAGSGVRSRFFSFYRETSHCPVKIEAAPTLLEIDHNPILEEYSAHQGKEQTLFYESSNADRKAET